MRPLAALFCGLVFGIGLAVSGMTDTAKVLGFLDLFGQWVPDLAFVMGAAVCVTLISFRVILRRSSPVLAESFSLPGSKNIDQRLLGGAAIFGIGWGIYGYCPGPAISALIYLDGKTVLFVAAMITGMALANRLSRG
ncbi:MAG: DUF6691 family protein [Halioglobus sp.]